jgi:hypothetical protein
LLITETETDPVVREATDAIYEAVKNDRDFKTAIDAYAHHHDAHRHFLGGGLGVKILHIYPKQCAVFYLRWFTWMTKPPPAFSVFAAHVRNLHKPAPGYEEEFAQLTDDDFLYLSLSTVAELCVDLVTNLLENLPTLAKHHKVSKDGSKWHNNDALVNFFEEVIRIMNTAGDENEEVVWRTLLTFHDDRILMMVRLFWTIPLIAQTWMAPPPRGSARKQVRHFEKIDG